MADELRAIVHAALRAPSPLARYRAGVTRRIDDGDIALVSDGGAGPDFNWVLVLGPAEPRHVFALAGAFFGAAQGYSIAVEVETARAIEDALREGGWRLDEEEPALVLPELPTVPPLAPLGLTIRPVADEAGLADFRLLSANGAGFVPSLAAATDPAVALLVGYVDGRPAATSRLVCLGTIAEITGVNTAPAFRRRGYGTALTWAAIAEGARRDCTAATLTATAMGYPVYLRMGFRPVCTYRTYLPPLAAGAG